MPSTKQPLELGQKGFGSPAWIRTTIHGSKGRCPTIRRPGNASCTSSSTSVALSVGSSQRARRPDTDPGPRLPQLVDLHLRRWCAPFRIETRKPYCPPSINSFERAVSSPATRPPAPRWKPVRKREESAFASSRRPPRSPTPHCVRWPASNQSMGWKSRATSQGKGTTCRSHFQRK